MSGRRTLAPAVLLAFLALVACAAPAGAGQPGTQNVSITYVKYPLNAPLILAKALGMFEKQFASAGWGVEWADIVTGPRQAEALASGAVQFASVISSDAVLASRSRGEPIRAIGIFARAPGTFCLMAKNPAIKRVSDLKGRTVAGPRGTLMHLMLQAALQKAGMAQTDVTFVDMPVASALTALLSGGVDAALAAGPGKIKAEAEGAREVTCGDGLTKGLILTAVNEDFLRDHPELVREYLKVHAQALAYLKAHHAQSVDIIASETGLTAAQVERLLPEYDFSPTVTDPDIQDLASVQEYLVRLGLVTKPVDPRGLFWP